ncbi:MAG: response regulator transcription factor [Deltaproteobacteria bacterium]|nr:response regulator transcription factor [Ignavibacteriales bacterium]MBI3752832.1 response regulator transcription factor [Deltaproteobacteria bacterium]
MKIFFVDGSPLGNGRLMNLLSDLKEIEIIGYALDGATAEDSINRTQPDIVILDIELPGRSGIDLLKHIKQTFPSLIVIILTNASHPQYRKRCMELGANFFFDKSTEFRKVPEVLKQLLQSGSEFRLSGSSKKR